MRSKKGKKIRFELNIRLTKDEPREKSKLKMIRRPQIQRETQLANKLREARENAREQVVIGSIFSQYPLRGRRKLSEP